MAIKTFENLKLFVPREFDHRSQFINAESRILFKMLGLKAFDDRRYVTDFRMISIVGSDQCIEIDITYMEPHNTDLKTPLTKYLEHCILHKASFDEMISQMACRGFSETRYESAFTDLMRLDALYFLYKKHFKIDSQFIDINHFFNKDDLAPYKLIDFNYLKASEHGAGHSNRDIYHRCVDVFQLKFVNVEALCVQTIPVQTVEI